MKTKILASVLAIAASSTAIAAGPLYIFDYETRTPYAYPGTVSVYTDMGNLGGMSNEQANAQVQFAWDQWNNVETSSFNAEIVGNFDDIGVGDATAANVWEIIGTDNGGGLHVIYDTDGTILSDFFGVGGGVLGIATPEYSINEDSSELYESWAVLNGAVIPDPDGYWYDVISAHTGTMTHEFGHAINLAHSQTNGAIRFYGDSAVAGDCNVESIGGAYATNANIETMYPYLNNYRTGAYQSTVDIRDDVVALSNIYPAEGWPEDFGSVEGQVTYSDGNTPTLGINVIARNVSDPFNDAISALSGDYTQGAIGPDGRYRLNGLTPGADYIVFIDGIVAGGFSTPYGFMPGPEEYWNGANESGDSNLDAKCEFELVNTLAGEIQQANIAINANPAAPQFTPVPVAGAQVTKLSSDGEQMSGVIFGAPYAWTSRKGRGFEYFPSTVSASISGNAKTVVGATEGNYENPSLAGFWNGGSDSTTLDDDSWSIIEPLEGTVGCGFSATSAWDISAAGDVVVGLNWNDCVTQMGFRWDATSGTVQLPLANLDSRGSRANTVSADGLVVAGKEITATGDAAGVVWKDGNAEIIYHDVDYYGTFGTYSVGQAWAVSADGSVVVGDSAIGPAEDGYPQSAWIWSEENGTEVLGHFPCPPTSWFCWSGSGHANAVSRDGVVVGGWGSDTFDREAAIWTRGLGYMMLEEFLEKQGVTSIEGWSLSAVLAIAGNGTVLGGWGTYGGAVYGWTVNIDDVDICHNPDKKGKTINVAFPHAMESHLEHGDSFGTCE